MTGYERVLLEVLEGNEWVKVSFNGRIIAEDGPFTAYTGHNGRILIHYDHDSISYIEEYENYLELTEDAAEGVDKEKPMYTEALIKQIAEEFGAEYIRIIEL